jgi:thiamine kinase-like enzyme
MDCQPLNILVSKLPAAATEDCHDRKIRLIDFEYAGWNPRASDIGNTFCEFCEMSNLRANYEDEYPSAQQQDEYFRHYCKRTVGANATAAEPTGPTDPSRPQSALDEFVSSVLNDSRNGRSVTIPIDRETLQRFIETLQCPDNHPSSWRVISSALSGEVGRYSLISHLSWCVWSLLKSQEEDGVLDFDYIVYARHRMDGYLWAKKKFFA